MLRSALVALLAVLTLPALAAEEASLPPAAPETAPAAPEAAPQTTVSAPGTTPGAMVAPVSPDIAKVVDPNTIPALRNLLQPGTVVRYMGNEYGLKGYFVTKDLTAQMIYLTPDEQGFILGSLFSADGTPTTFLQLGRMKQAGFDVDTYINNMNDVAKGRKLSPEVAEMATGRPSSAPLSPGEQLLKDLNGASWIAFGPPSAPMVTAFMDPECPSCHDFFKALLPLTQQNKIYLRVVPVGIITPGSTDQAVALLSAAKPAEAWAAQMKGTPPPAPTSLNAQAPSAVQANNELFTKWKLPGTPYSVYRAADGQIKIVYGLPTDMAAFQADLGVQ